jgi:hypothetical protein
MARVLLEGRDRGPPPCWYSRLIKRAHHPILSLYIPSLPLGSIRTNTWHKSEGPGGNDCPDYRRRRPSGYGVSGQFPTEPHSPLGRLSALLHSSRPHQGHRQRRRPPKRQKAITPKFLRYLQRLRSTESHPCTIDHAVDLLTGGFFFATRPCEIVRIEDPGRTKTLSLRNLHFRTLQQKTISPLSPTFVADAEFVTGSITVA